MLYPSAKVIVRSNDKPNMILLLERKVGNNSYFEPAGGRIEADFNQKISESLEECAHREIAEELGLSIEIKRYIGSYFFFWTIDSNKLSICAVFEGLITQHDPQFESNKDFCELPFNPVWISMRDILEGNIFIDPIYVGLEKILKDYCRKIRS
ncbi:MAG: NUDIX hydrolase [Candidatus Babeliales bacterium]